MFENTMNAAAKRLKAIPARIWAVVLMVLTLSLVLMFTAASLRLTYVKASDGANRLLLTRESDPTHLMRLSGIHAEEGDHGYYTAFGGSLASLNIVRASTATIVDGEEEIEISFLYGTAKTVLEQAGIVLGEDDYLDVNPDEEVLNGDEIVVHRVEYVEETEEYTIPYEMIEKGTSLYYLTPNKTTLIRRGEDGVGQITSRLRYVDGELESREVLSDEVLTPAVDEVTLVYEPEAPVSARVGLDGTMDAPDSYRRVLQGKATGYYAPRGQGASGLGLGYGTVAVDPDIIPYGSLLYICSQDGRFVYGYAIATDTGTALVDGRVLVDLFYETYDESKSNGAIQVNVYVVE